jgi:hypothetical protein
MFVPANDYCMDDGIPVSRHPPMIMKILQLRVVSVDIGLGDTGRASEVKDQLIRTLRF